MLARASAITETVATWRSLNASQWVVTDFTFTATTHAEWLNPILATFCTLTLRQLIHDDLLLAPVHLAKVMSGTPTAPNPLSSCLPTADN